MSHSTETRLAPSDISAEQLASLLRAVQSGGKPVLLDQYGERFDLPRPLQEVLVAIIEAFRRNESVLLMPENKALATQAAADFLGVSRQYLVRLLDEERIPSHRVGTHRRVFLRDLSAFEQARRVKRRAILDEMTDMVVAAGLDDVVADLTRED